MKSSYKKVIISFILCLITISINTHAGNKTNKKIIFVNMIADLFHAGHVAFLEKAKQHGDLLVVGLHSDEVVAKYKNKPICSLEERAVVVKACKYVDKVICDTPLIIDRNFINKHNIDLVIHGDDFDEEQIIEFYSDAINLNKFTTVPYTPKISTNIIISRIQNYTSKQIDKSLSSIIYELERL